MNQHEDIQHELEMLSPDVARISRENVFTVPAGYFEILSSELLLQVQFMQPESHKEIQNSVPEGYFDSLADNIMARIKQESLSEANLEIRELSTTLAGIGNQNVYKVPDGYFEALEGQIWGAFSRLSSEVYQETNDISSVVAAVGNKNVYSVPAGYFAKSVDQLAAIKSPARVVSMKGRFTAFRYAAAAVITGLLGLSLFFMLNKKTPTQPTMQTAAVLNDAQKIIQTNSFEKEFTSVSDAAIVAYLESKGQDVEAALVASLTDDKNLPEAEDYIINENTLDEVLKTLDLNN